jgi:hypothetical protein
LFAWVISSLTALKVSQTAVAGRHRLKITPLAICAMSKDPDHPFKERLNPGAYSELTEYGFRRGVSYNLLKLSPKTSSAVNYVVDPISLPPKSGNFSTSIIGAYVCTGTVELPRVIGETLNLQSGFPISDMINALNSRFNLYSGTGKCDAAAAPPDSNIKQFPFGSLAWMNAPHDQVADPASTPNRMETLADLDPPNDQDPTVYGPLWAFARPVPWSAYTPGNAEPTKGYAPFEASKAVWDAIYKSGPVLKTYPTDAKTGLQTPPYFPW